MRVSDSAIEGQAGASALDRVISLELTGGVIQRRTDEAYPTSIAGWGRDEPLLLDEDGTHFGFVLEGDTTIECSVGSYRLRSGMYFSVPGKAVVRDGRGFVATRHAFQGLFTVGGPLEQRGRLRYIDGCSDSVLVGPVVLGDPCLNMLYVPPGIDQTAHTHPTVRVGMIADGGGVCKTPDGDVELAAGRVFVLPPDALHSFHTRDQHLRIVVYHPDSDTGPSHDDHPMLNRTHVDGRSAAQIDAIRTR